MKDLMLELNYKQKGYITTNEINEHAFLCMDILETEIKEKHYEEFISKIKQALKAFNNKSICDVGVILYRGLKDQKIIVHHAWNEKGEEIYYVYQNEKGTIFKREEVKDKKQIIEIITKEIEDYLKENNIEVKKRKKAGEKITEKEEKIIKILSEYRNYEKLEDELNYNAVGVYIKDLEKKNIDTKIARGLLGSLIKKGYMYVDEVNGEKVYMATEKCIKYIYEKN